MFLSKFDLITPPIGLFYRGKGSHSSVISGIITLLAYLIIIYFAVRYSLEYIKKKKPSAYYVNRHIDDAGSYNVNSTSFFHYLFLSTKRNREIIEFDFDSFRIIGFNSINYQAFLSAHPLKYENTDHWIYGKCDIDIDANDEDTKNLIPIQEFSKAACIKKYYNPANKAYYDVNDKNYVAPKIEHGMSNENYTFYSFIIEKCKDDDLRKLAGLGSCKNKDAIDSILKSSFINIKILDNYPDVLNYNQPFKKYLYSTNSLLYTDSFVSNSINFNPALLKTNYGIVFDRSRIKYAYMFYETLKVMNDEAFSLVDEEGKKLYDENGKEITKSTGFIATFDIFLQNRSQHYERTYQKLQDLLSKIGGFGKTTFLIASTINIIFFRFVTILDTEDFVLSLNKNLNNNNDETMCNVLQKYPQEKNKVIYNLNSPNLYENNLNKKYLDQQLPGNEISKIKQNITNIKDGPVPNDKGNDNSIGNSIKPSYSPGGLLNKAKTHNNFCWCQYIWYMICCGTSNKNITYYEKFRQKMLSEENIIISNYNLYKLISLLGLDNSDELIFDKNYTLTF
jgi:hypothetical protein